MTFNKKHTAGELSQTAYQWLRGNGITLNAGYCREEITAHPDYPALTSLTDFLESGGMEYEAVEADASYVNEFRYPLLAHIKKPGNEYLHLVDDVTGWKKENEIIKDWSGIALYAGKYAIWQHEENDQRQQQSAQNNFIAAGFVSAGIVLFAASVFLYPHLLINLFGFLSLAGLAISIAALGTELGYQSKLVKEVCGTVGKGGCEKVLKSKFAKGIAGITPADASVLYFAAEFISYMIGCFYVPVFPALFAAAFAGIAVAAWSIYIQAVKLKEWCALCLCIAAVLGLQVFLSGFYFTNTHSTLSFTTFSLLGLLALLFTLIFVPVKKLIKSNSNLIQEADGFRKWKTDASLFLTQLEKEPACDNSIWENDLLIGNRNAPIRITVACNPYCEPCANAHKELDTLLEKYPGKINVQVKLLCDPTNENDNRRIATEAILQKVAALKMTVEIKHMLTDWFDHMNLEKWQGKWQPVENADVKDTIHKHTRWMKETGITHTPTIFVNGKKLPGRYNLNDIEKLVPQLAYTFAAQGTHSEN